MYKKRIEEELLMHVKLLESTKNTANSISPVSSLAGAKALTNGLISVHFPAALIASARKSLDSTKMHNTMPTQNDFGAVLAMNARKIIVRFKK
jgi:hypothetical protein